ncbi:MAG TPA: hypothetical protein VKW06_10355 [Candidatus Angelobacter sp.]|nr:hypothetical protein [Candidatus Angelobacter sp.]
MAYIRANTQNSNGWRPNTVRLGSMSHPAAKAPNWANSVQRLEGKQRAAYVHARNAQRHEQRTGQIQDANARRSHTPNLSGLGAYIPGNTQMVQGATYLFHFSGSAIGASMTNMDTLRSKIAADSNFLNPVVTAESTGLQVNFVYNGQGATVATAGAEMQNVLSNWSWFDPLSQAGRGYSFASAEGGPAQGAASAAQGKQVLTTSPDGTVIQYTDGSFTDLTSGVTYDASGNVVSQSTPAPGNNNPNPNSGFSWTQLLASMGLSAGAGALIAGGVLLVLLIRE